MPIQISSLSELSNHLSKSKDKLSVIKFEAQWCGPCHTIAPAFNALAEKYKGVNFFKVDVEKARDVAQQYRVSAMPTFIFLRGDTKVDQVRGPNRPALEEAVRKHASGSSSSTGAFSGKGHTLGGKTTTSSTSAIAQEYMNLSPLDPQLQVLLFLVGGYLLLLWL
ncbi:thioredoxin-domain-containing protein [Flagelloscypha sp. PMI_526]|nr:thioredoxin-domain-containing protein [Flagelloscypha sp. PMI_526]